jgi:hypothetical protein
MKKKLKRPRGEPRISKKNVRDCKEELVHWVNNYENGMKKVRLRAVNREKEDRRFLLSLTPPGQGRTGGKCAAQYGQKRTVEEEEVSLP